jgi:Family of unknown function (DUF6714)
MRDDVKALRESIIDEIRQAFGRVSREDGVTLHEAVVIDNFGSEEERIAARALDPDLCWQDVPDHLIEDHHEALCFVDPKGFCYYLPAYMVWALRHFETSESVSVDHAIYSLTLSGDQQLRAWHLERFRVFGAHQAKAICRFLRFMAAQENFVDAQQALAALERYWGKFCVSTLPPTAGRGTMLKGGKAELETG